MIKTIKHKTKEEIVAAFKRAMETRRAWEDLVEGKITKQEFEQKGYKTIGIKR